jgi:signal transduction histidine kinase
VFQALMAAQASGEDAAAMDREFWEAETTITRQDGSGLLVNVSRTGMYDTERILLGDVTVVRDISQAKALAEQKKRFIANASHELRTPVANLKTRLYLIRRQPERIADHLEVADSAVNWLQNLIEHLFDLSRFESGIMTLDTEHVDIRQVIRQTWTFQEPEAERRDLVFDLDTPDEPVFVEADPYRLAQVITNLISNAIAHSQDAGMIRAVIRELPADAQVQIEIHDTGEGIPAEHLPYLFQPFYQIQKSRTGAGLGLAIAKEIVDRHHGEITVTSEVGVGSCFRILLPLKQPAPA